MGATLGTFVGVFALIGWLRRWLGGFFGRRLGRGGDVLRGKHRIFDRSRFGGQGNRRDHGGLDRSDGGRVFTPVRSMNVFEDGHGGKSADQGEMQHNRSGKTAAEPVVPFLARGGVITHLS
jgi:hypothetical protein